MLVHVLRLRDDTLTVNGTNILGSGASFQLGFSGQG
jgi:hypothetical protein